MLSAENIIYAIVPSLIGLVVVYKSDRNKEPLKSILFAFAIGGFLCIPATILFVGMLEPFFGITEDPLYESFLDSTFYSSIPEELFKYLALLFLWKNHKEFDEPADCIVYATSVSLGFAAIENIGYLYSYGDSVLLIRSISAVPLHAACGMLIAIELRKQRYDKLHTATKSHMDAVIPAITLHAAYNFSVFIEVYFITICIIGFCFYFIKKTVKNNTFI